MFDRIELQHLGCLHGGCPVYSVAINQNGIVSYHGYRDVTVIGQRRTRARDTALRQLAITLNDPAVFWLHARYTPGNDDCGVWSLDGALVRIEIDTPTFRRQIVHYLGCHGAPMLLIHIENDVDRVADIQRWVRKQPSGLETSPLQH